MSSNSTHLFFLCPPPPFFPLSPACGLLRLPHPSLPSHVGLTCISVLLAPARTHRDPAVSRAFLIVKPGGSGGGMRACHSREHGQKTGQLQGKHAGQPRAWSRPVSGEGNLELPTMPFPGLCLCFPGALAALPTQPLHSSHICSPFLKLKHPFSSHPLQASHVLSPYLANAYSSLKTPLRKPSPNALPCPTRGL